MAIRSHYGARSESWPVYQAAGRRDEAVHALDLCPDCLRADRDLASVHKSHQDWPAALETIDRALDRYPYQADLLAERAAVLFARSGASDATAAAARRSLELDPNRPQTLWLWAGIEGARGRPAGAIAALERLRAAEPKSLRVLLALGPLLCKQGRYAEAAEVLEELRKLAPMHPAIPRIERELDASRKKDEHAPEKVPSGN